MKVGVIVWLVSQATTRMRETLDANTVLQAAAHEMRQTLGFAAVEVRLDLPRK